MLFSFRKQLEQVYPFNHPRWMGIIRNSTFFLPVSSLSSYYLRSVRFRVVKQLFILNLEINKVLQNLPICKIKYQQIDQFCKTENDTFLGGWKLLKFPNCYVQTQISHSLRQLCWNLSWHIRFERSTSLVGFAWE